MLLLVLDAPALVFNAAPQTPRPLAGCSHAGVCARPLLPRAKISLMPAGGPDEPGKDRAAGTGFMQPSVDDFLATGVGGVAEQDPVFGNFERINAKLIEASQNLRKEEMEYAEDSRKYRRTVYMHNEWLQHRSPNRFIKNMLTIGKSGVGSNLGAELGFITGVSFFVVLINMLLFQYQDLSGVVQEAPLRWLWLDGPWSLPAMPFTVMMPALSLLLVFRTNTGYARWNEARTLWGGVVNTCRNVARQANTFYPRTPEGSDLRDRMAGNTIAYCKALRNFLRGPADDDTFRAELYELADANLFTHAQADKCMEAKNRPMFCLSAMSANLRAANLDPMSQARVDQSIALLVDLTGACERIFKSPVPLVYTRHTSRFLIAFLILLPFGIWEATGKYWNHWVTIPATDVIAFFLLGIEEIGIQIEEPFSILPLEALCNGAIEATIDEMVTANNNDAFMFDGVVTPSAVAPPPAAVAAPAVAPPAVAPPAVAPPAVAAPVEFGGKGFGGGEATRDPAPTLIDPSDPKGKQQAIFKAESFADYLARREGA